MESATPVQFLDDAVCVLFCANAHKKGINPSLLYPAMGK